MPEDNKELVASVRDLIASIARRMPDQSVSHGLVVRFTSAQLREKLSTVKCAVMEDILKLAAQEDDPAPRPRNEYGMFSLSTNAMRLAALRERVGFAEFLLASLPHDEMFELEATSAWRLLHYESDLTMSAQLIGS